MQVSVKRKNQAVVCLLVLSMLCVLSATPLERARAEEQAAVDNYRYEWLYDGWFGGPTLGVWLQFTPGVPHAYNADRTDAHVNSSVPYSDSYGLARTRIIDLSIQWHYYDPTSYYGLAATAVVQGVSGYVPFSWDGPPHTHNDEPIVPPEARDLPYPYGVALTAEDGSVLDWTSEGTSYDTAADTVDDALGAVGLPTADSLGGGSGNIFTDGWNQMLDYLGDFEEFLTSLLGGEEVEEFPWSEWLDQLRR